jgi:hypothetical protein
LQRRFLYRSVGSPFFFFQLNPREDVFPFQLLNFF